MNTKFYLSVLLIALIAFGGTSFIMCDRQATAAAAPAKSLQAARKASRPRRCRLFPGPRDRGRLSSVTKAWHEPFADEFRVPTRRQRRARDEPRRLAPADRIVQKIAERGHVSATRVHNVPRESFERQVESDNPPNSRAKARSPGFYS
jgi:hypothetical protein